MGYKLSSLLRLPFEEDVEMYVFSIGDKLWKGSLHELVHKNFDNLAREIGPNAIIVEALQNDFHGEVVEKYLGKHYDELKNDMPALLITDSHPDALGPDSLRILIPLGDVHQHYPAVDHFLSDLATFVRGDSDVLLKRLEEGIKPLEAAGEIIRISIPVVPGFVAVNLNHAVKQLRKWWSKKVTVTQTAVAPDTKGASEPQR